MENAKIFIEKSDGGFDTQFLKLASSQPDLMTDDLVDKLHDIVYSRVLQIQDKVAIKLDDAYDNLEIISNMIEYLDG